MTAKIEIPMVPVLLMEIRKCEEGYSTTDQHNNKITPQSVMRTHVSPNDPYARYRRYPIRHAVHIDKRMRTQI